MESIVVAIITGVVTLAGTILSSPKIRVVMEVKLDAPRRRSRSSEQVLKRTHKLERDMAVAKSDIADPREEGGLTWTSPLQAATGSGTRCARWCRTCWAWWSRPWTYSMHARVNEILGGGSGSAMLFTYKPQVLAASSARGAEPAPSPCRHKVLSPSRRGSPSPIMS